MLVRSSEEIEGRYLDDLSAVAMKKIVLVGEEISAKEALPEGFFDMIGERGLIVEEWAPQKRISSHPGIGGFLSHCGWNSVLESMRFGDPIIAMPFYVDQPLNAGFVVEVGAGLEIKGDKNEYRVREDLAIFSFFKFVKKQARGFVKVNATKAITIPKN
ncbi:hypothetical protein POTOM_038949 [Populus tomentosa]|uniref:Uncharacterized protein n=1 Tax=Populus tomentosa TaxID=118781 RepID=A0A8X7Z825_POPTO|nr:hypothetical protein POTOM_038949 [Populus tomentosa]